MVKNILIYGSGYVGSSLAVLLSTHYKVVLVDTDCEKVDKINNKVSPIEDSLMSQYFAEKKLNLIAATDGDSHIKDADMIILALPTNYDALNNFFDTSILLNVITALNTHQYKKSIVIKSTIPIGFTASIKEKFTKLDIVNVPEFLREGNAIKDNLYPSRIIIGNNNDNFNDVEMVFSKIAKNNPDILRMSSDEAEAVKLFANTYLATRISFFNELDSFAYDKKLNTKNIIDGLCSDPRVGTGYNNPSFGYGGYCLPKDTKQLLANFDNIPQKIFTATVNSNIVRKKFIAEKIINLKPNMIGVYRLVMKKGSSNFRESAMIEIIRLLKERGMNILIFEPLLNKEEEFEYEITSSLSDFKKRSDIILANRLDDSLIDIMDKVFTRDIYNEN